MRSTGVTILVLLILAGSAWAQGHPQGQGQPQIPPGFTPEDWQTYAGFQQELQKAFQYKEYAKGVEILPKCIAILDKAIGRVESGDADEEKKKQALKFLREGVRGRFGGLAGDWYNLACCQSMTGDKPAAIASIRKAVDLGWLDVDHMKVDTDLDPIREEAGFKAILAGLGYNDVMEIYVPEGIGEGPKPLLLALHKTNGNETGFMEQLKGVADKTKVIMAFPRGPITLASEQFGWKRHSDDEEGALKKIKATIAAAQAKHAVDHTKIILMGAGDGGYFSCLYALMHPGSILGAIPINAFWNKYYFSEVVRGEDTFAKAKAGGTKFCMIINKENPFHKKAAEAVEKLTAGEIPAKLVEFEGENKTENVKGLIEDAVLWMLK